MSTILHPVLPTSDVKQTSAVAVPGRPLGAVAFDAHGNKYRWVKTKSAIVGPGYILGQQSAGITAVSNITAYNTTTGRITDNTAVTLSAGELAGAMLFVQGGTGEGQLGVIAQHAAFAAAAPTFDIAELFATALSTDSDINIINPFVVDLTTAGSLDEIPVGVSVGAVTDEYYCWVLEEGYGVVAVKGAAPSAGDMITAGGATDAGKGLAESATYDVSGHPIAKVIIAAASSDSLHFCKIACKL